MNRLNPLSYSHSRTSSVLREFPFMIFSHHRDTGLCSSLYISLKLNILQAKNKTTRRLLFSLQVVFCVKVLSGCSDPPCRWPGFRSPSYDFLRFQNLAQFSWFMWCKHKGPDLLQGLCVRSLCKNAITWPAIAGCERTRPEYFLFSPRFPETLFTNAPWLPGTFMSQINKRIICIPYHATWRQTCLQLISSALIVPLPLNLWCRIDEAPDDMPLQENNQQ